MSWLHKPDQCRVFLTSLEYGSLYRAFLTISDTYVVMPIVVHEFVKEAVPEKELMKPQQLERRACLFRQRIPPDQLNPQVSDWHPSPSCHEEDLSSCIAPA